MVIQGFLNLGEFGNICLFSGIPDTFQVQGLINELAHKISNNVECATSKGSGQPAHTRSLIRALASCLNILCVLRY